MHTNENQTIVVNPSNRYRRIQRNVKSQLDAFTDSNRYSLYHIRGAFKQLERLRGFFDILVVDLRHAYESITYTRIVGLLRSRGLEPADQWAKYCVYNGTLMRGSVCSNAILESLIIRLDYRLAGLARKQNFFMKRYCDEYWFYGDFTGKNLQSYLHDVQRATREEGFRLNEHKTYVEHKLDNALGEDGSHRPNQSRGGYLWSK